MTRLMRIVVALGLLVAAFGVVSEHAPDARAADPANLDVGFTLKASGLVDPVAVVSAHDGTGRLFIVEQAGRIRIWTPGGGVRSTPYLAIRGKVRSGGEQGMLGLAFHPNFKSNRYFFVSYTDDQGDLRIVRFRAGATYTDNTANESSHTIIMQVTHRTYSNHNAGQLNFGGKYLFISTGDGGGSGDPGNNAQDLSSKKGKILRIDVDRRCGGKRYCNPSTNPFAGPTPGIGSIYHYGLRNPWRWSFDRTTKRMWIADVGQDALEEIDTVGKGVKGVNFGWDCREGTQVYSGASYCSGENFRPPVREYPHSQGSAVIGGYMYRGSDYPAMKAVYLYTDFYSKTVWGLARRSGGGWTSAQVGTAPGNVSSFGERGDGEIFAVTYDGRLWKVTGSAA